MLTIQFSHIDSGKSKIVIVNDYVNDGGAGLQST